MKIHVSDLILEITRRCNMCCEHCLRGEAENLDMSKGQIDEILSQVDSIFSVVFTGGEPTLNLPIIEYFFKRAKELNKMPSSFWLATNGKKHQLELAILLLKIYPEMDEQEECGVAISQDEFHEDVGSDILRGLAFYDSSKERHDDSQMWIIREGKAKNWGAHEGYHNHLEAEAYYVDGEEHIDVTALYVNPLGKWLPDCDYSYESQNQVAMGDIHNLRDDLHAWYMMHDRAC